jgi:hypothetical protein
VHVAPPAAGRKCSALYAASTERTGAEPQPLPPPDHDSGRTTEFDELAENVALGGKPLATMSVLLGTSMTSSAQGFAALSQKKLPVVSLFENWLAVCDVMGTAPAMLGSYSVAIETVVTPVVTGRY